LVLIWEHFSEIDEVVKASAQKPIDVLSKLKKILVLFELTELADSIKKYAHRFHASFPFNYNAKSYFAGPKSTPDHCTQYFSGKTFRTYAM
jgi:hypothetical protein